MASWADFSYFCPAPKKYQSVNPISKTPVVVTNMAAVSIGQFLSILKRRRRRALVSTLTDESAIAAEAITGFNSQPVSG